MNAPALEAVFFENLLDGHGSDRIADVCLKSCSAPLYFEAHDGFLDGALFENNPVACCFPLLFGVEGRRLDPRDVVCLSLSTGAPTPPFFDHETFQDAGCLKWGPHVLDLLQYSRVGVSPLTPSETRAPRPERPAPARASRC